MNKKLLTTVIVGVMAMALVTAGLVTYLSNPVTADVTIENPLELSILNNNDAWSDSTNLGSVYGGDTVTFFTKETNNADVEIPAQLVITITDKSTPIEGEMSCDMLDALDAYVKVSDNYDTLALDLKNDATCVPNNYNHKIVYSFNKYVAVGTNVFKIEAVPALGMVGDYTVNAQFMPQ